MCVCNRNDSNSYIYVSLYVDIYSTNFCIYVMYTVLMYICVCVINIVLTPYICYIYSTNSHVYVTCI